MCQLDGGRVLHLSSPSCPLHRGLTCRLRRHLCVNLFEPFEYSFDHVFLYQGCKGRFSAKPDPEVGAGIKIPDDQGYIGHLREYFRFKLDRSNRGRDRHGLEVEDFGQPDNLMMSSAVTNVAASSENAVKLLETIVTES